MAITFEETVQTVLNLVRQNEQLQQQLKQATERIQQLESAEVNPNPEAHK